MLEVNTLIIIVPLVNVDYRDISINDPSEHTNCSRTGYFVHKFHYQKTTFLSRIECF